MGTNTSREYATVNSITYTHVVKNCSGITLRVYMKSSEDIVFLKDEDGLGTTVKRLQVKGTLTVSEKELRHGCVYKFISKSKYCYISYSDSSKAFNCKSLPVLWHADNGTFVIKPINLSKSPKQILSVTDNNILTDVYEICHVLESTNENSSQRVEKLEQPLKLLTKKLNLTFEQKMLLKEKCIRSNPFDVLVYLSKNQKVPDHIIEILEDPLQRTAGRYLSFKL